MGCTGKDHWQPAFFLLAQAPPVFPIRPSHNARASAFLLDNSTAVTALHAVRREAPPTVRGRRTKLHRYCLHADLAILSLSTRHHTKPIRTTLANPTCTNYTIISPYGDPITASLIRIDTAFIVYSGCFVPALTLTCSKPVPRGWSGSPVLDEFSRVVGVLVQSRGHQCHAIPTPIIEYVRKHSSQEAKIGHLLASELTAKFCDGASVHSINGHELSEEGCIDWGAAAPLQSSVFDVPNETVDGVITHAGVDQVVKLKVGTAADAVALQGRRSECVVYGEYVVEAVSVELLEVRYGERWGGADLVDDVLCEGDDVVVFVQDAGEGLLFKKIESVDGRAVTGLADVIDGGVLRVGGQDVNVGRGTRNMLLWKAEKYKCRTS